MKLSNLILSIFALLSSAKIYATNVPNNIKNEKKNISFIYSNMTMNSVGIYNPKVDGEKNGLSAELIARKNALDNLEKYFENSCDGLDKSSLNVRSDWENNFRSQGTEIYANGVLAVSLQAPMKQVFKTSSKARKNLRTDNGEKIAFQIKNPVQTSGTRCGTMELDLNPKQKMHLMPTEVIASPPSYVKVIHLVYNKEKSMLELDPEFKKSNMDIIENSNLADIEDLSSEITTVTMAVDGKLDE